MENKLKSIFHQKTLNGIFLVLRFLFECAMPCLFDIVQMNQNLDQSVPMVQMLNLTATDFTEGRF